MAYKSLFTVEGGSSVNPKPYISCEVEWVKNSPGSTTANWQIICRGRENQPKDTRFSTKITYSINGGSSIDVNSYYSGDWKKMANYASNTILASGSESYTQAHGAAAPTITMNLSYVYIYSERTGTSGSDDGPDNEEEQKEWTISYNSNGGSSVSSQVKKQGTTLYLRGAPSRSGSDTTITTTFNNNYSGGGSTKGTSTKTLSYSFNHWIASSGGTYGAGAAYTRDGEDTMTASWSSSTDYGKVSLPTPSRSYYTFAGWYTAASGGKHITSYAPTEDSTLYAHWTPKTYTIKYDGNGGTTPSNQTKTADVTLTLRGASSRGNDTYTITTTFNNNYPGGGSSTGTSTRTYSYSFAYWRDAEGATYSGGGSYTKNYGNTLTAGWSKTTSYSQVSLPSPSRTYYDFAGWYTAASGGNKITSYAPTGNSTLYAHWIPHTYRINYDVDGGTSVSAQTKTADITLILHPAISHNDTYRTITTTYNQNFSGSSPLLRYSTETTYYSFKHWMDGQGDTYAGRGSYTKNQTNTILAKWNYRYSYTAVEVPTPPRRPGYHFLGWFTSPTGGNQITSLTPTRDTTLYAHWQKYADAILYVYINGTWREFLPYIYNKNTVWVDPDKKR